MKALDSLQAVITDVANRSAISSEVASVLPVYEFKILGDRYDEFVQKLKETNNADLIKHIFVSGSYEHGVRANFYTINRLINEFSATPEITANAELAVVYSRLAGLSTSLAINTGNAATKIKIASDRIYGLLSNTQAFSELTNAKIFFKIKEKAEVTNTKAKFIVDIDSKSTMEDSVLLKRTIKNAKIAGLDILAREVNRELHKTNLTELTQRFFTSVEEEFNGRVAPNSLYTSMQEFTSRKLDIANDVFKQVANETRRKVINLDETIREITSTRQESRQDGNGTSSASLKAILNAGLRQAIENRMAPTTAPLSSRYLRYAGGYGKSYNTEEGRFARSASVVSATTSQSGKFTNIKYDYLRYPYDVFSRGGRLFTMRARDVQYIIKMAITDLARNLITNKLQITPV
jgi:hypothetical protein